ncbi:hypothetical protein DY262_10935 [Hydrogenophaga borbori]|uniref:TauD/TfdA-like domain-containing protein n=2 Tax=Hydrogenophaga borbori TaxID=2294117 RepID=A0A372EIZ0_9BURK|nr:hypothetical protein DY262_10935 [Hydrogenophaga borbori]
MSMHTEIHLDQAELSEVAAAILALEHSDNALVIRTGKRQQLARSDWSQLLQEQCHLTLDARQYSYDENLVLEPWWEISNQPDKANSYAYSTTPQPFHNDNAWFADPAEINFFVMEKQAVSGGEQLIYPVSRLINDLQALDASLFDDLTTIPVTIRKGGDDFQNLTPIITLEDGGRVYWNYYRTVKTDPHVNDMCERFFAFLKQQEGSSSTYSVRCETGDSLAFNDQRLLHARTAFVAHQPRDRVLYQSMWRLPRRNP